MTSETPSQIGPGASQHFSSPLAESVARVTDDEIGRLEKRLGLLLLGEVADVLFVLGTLSSRERRAALYVFAGAIKPLLCDMRISCEQIRNGGQ